ncbi:hypothetical protein Tcan_08840 [Toxocara canis]|uniref:Uncharacterized protein n=1 Tax=Toxocara canis TaxID=6265 RepID=A0A0B2ULP3_TOXCA|nr:hypothetical protein Tcan_08840 [Toxocara canis]
MGKTSVKTPNESNPKRGKLVEFNKMVIVGNLPPSNSFGDAYVLLYRSKNVQLADARQRVLWKLFDCNSLASNLRNSSGSLRTSFIPPLDGTCIEVGEGSKVYRKQTANE